MVAFPPLKSLGRPPRVPDYVRIYAIGDIHGRADLLQSLLVEIERDMRRRPVIRPIQVFLGDYIDRGPASSTVLTLLADWQMRGHEPIFLKGNHEQFLLSFLQTGEGLEAWECNGGLATLVSYGVLPLRELAPTDKRAIHEALQRKMPRDHRCFLRALKTAFCCGDFFFVHAGVRPGIALEDQDEDDMLWIRDEFLTSDDDFGKMIVHGHTPVLMPKPRGNRIDIDTAAYATGKLTCLCLEADGYTIL
jgi:serine/threonine protein phosphatase 1